MHFHHKIFGHKIFEIFHSKAVLLFCGKNVGKLEWLPGVAGLSHWYSDISKFGRIKNVVKRNVRFSEIDFKHSLTNQPQGFDPVEKLLGKAIISAQIQLSQIEQILYQQKTPGVSDPVVNFNNFIPTVAKRLDRFGKSK